MTITGLAGYGDNRQRLTACRSALPLTDKQEIAVLNGGYRPILPRQLHQKAGVAFISLVKMIDRLVQQVLSQRHL